MGKIQYGSTKIDTDALATLANADVNDQLFKNHPQLINTLVNTDSSENPSQQARALKNALVASIAMGDFVLFNNLWKAYQKAYKAYAQQNRGVLQTNTAARSSDLLLILKATTGPNNFYWPGNQIFWGSFFNSVHDFGSIKTNVFLLAVMRDNIDFALELWKLYNNNDYVRPGNRNNKPGGTAALAGIQAEGTVIDLLNRTTAPSGQTVFHVSAEKPELWLPGNPFFEQIIKPHLNATNSNVQDADGRSPMHIAVAAGNNDAVTELLKHSPNLSLPCMGKNRNVQAKAGYLLEQALLLKQYKIAELLVKYIQQQGPTCEHKRILTDASTGRNTPYQLALDLEQNALAEIISGAIVATGAGARPSPRAADAPTTTPSKSIPECVKAAQQGYAATKALVEHQRHTLTTPGTILGNYSKNFNQAEFDKFINAQDPETGDTALHAAAARGDAMTVSYLLKQGANRLAPNSKTGKYASAVAEENGHAYIPALINNRENDLLPDHDKPLAKEILAAANQNDDQKIINILSKQRRGVRAKFGKDADEQTFLFKLLQTPVGLIDEDISVSRDAAYTLNTPVLHYLIANSFPIENIIKRVSLDKRSVIAALQDSSKYGTALHTAAWAGNTEAIRFLKPYTPENLGSLRNGNKDTILHTAALAGQENMVQFLLKDGHTFNLQDKNSQELTALQLAENTNQTGIANVIREKMPADTLAKADTKPNVLFTLCGMEVQAKHLWAALAAVVVVGTYVGVSFALNEFNPGNWIDGDDNGPVHSSDLFTSAYAALSDTTQSSVVEPVAATPSFKI